MNKQNGYTRKERRSETYSTIGACIVGFIVVIGLWYLLIDLLY